MLEGVKNMAPDNPCMWGATWLLIGFAMLAIVFPESSWAKKEAAAKRYRTRERMSSRSYEGYETKPTSNLPFVEVPATHKDLITISSMGASVRRRKYLANAHVGLKFYESLNCVDCHPAQARSLHNRGARITCRQCHGPEPISGISHYYSSMNPRRRYAHICAKCHEGASASFAKYVIHEPSPALMSTQRAFPLLFYVFWSMVALAVGTFAAFLPHTFLWGLREFFPHTFRLRLKNMMANGGEKDGKD